MLALKLTLKAEDDTKLGVLKLTRKLINGGVATDDDNPTNALTPATAAASENAN